MKKTLLLLVISWMFLSATAGNIKPELLHSAIAFMQSRHSACAFLSQESLVNDNDTTIGYLLHFKPAGFLILSASEKTAPVYAYSVESDFAPPAREGALLRTIISKDLQARAMIYGRITISDRQKIALKWRSFLQGSTKSPLFEQWPPEGTTSTGGWLETNWTQSAPYNMMCPMDLNAGSRTVAGCPAIAMAQILNYHQEINQTRFNSGDDYYHNYGSGNSYWIDDDYLSRGFPCYDTLNLWLDTLESAYQSGGDVSNSLKAALCFACGVAAHQVYSASVSGTYGLDQAIMAFQRFGFVESRLVLPDDTTLNSLIAENVKVALPVQLGLIVSTGSGGHNVVVDGYNTDEFYHFNFGWGGQANGWYTIPPSNIPYNLTIVEGAVLDIKSSLYSSVPGSKDAASIVKVFPNPWKDNLVIHGLKGPGSITLYDLSGNQVFTAGLPGQNSSVSTGNIPAGCYIYRIFTGDVATATGKLVKE
jgi:hypothetical protein